MVPVVACSMLDVLSIVFKALAECPQILQETRLQMKNLALLLHTIEAGHGNNHKSQLSRKLLECLVHYVKVFAAYLFSFDVHKAMAYLPEIDAALTDLTELVVKIEQNLQNNGADLDDVIDDLEIAQIMANEIYQKLKNAVEKAKSDNMWHCVGYVGGTTVAGGLAGAAIAVATAPVAASTYSVAGVVSMLQGTSIGAAVFGPAAATAATTAATTVAAASGIGLAVGLVGYGGYYMYNRSSIQDEADARNLTIAKLDEQIRELQTLAKDLLLQTEEQRRRVASSSSSLLDVLIFVFKKLAECQQIRHETRSQMKNLAFVLHTIIEANHGKNHKSQLSEKLFECLVRYVEVFAVYLFSFDVRKAMKYLPEIDAALTDLAEHVVKIEDHLEKNGSDLDDVIDDLEMAQTMAEAIFKKLNNAVQAKARIAKLDEKIRELQTLAQELLPQTEEEQRRRVAAIASGLSATNAPAASGTTSLASNVGATVGSVASVGAAIGASAVQAGISVASAGVSMVALPVSMWLFTRNFPRGRNF